MRTLAVLLLVLVAGLVAACGGSDDASSSAADAKDALASVKPIDSATVDAVLRINLDNAPAQVGNKVELSFSGPMRANGPGKLPSLDWKLGFDSGFSSFTSRVVSTGNNVFINLGGADFAVGEQNVSRLNQTAASSGKGDGLAAVGLDPLAAVTGVKESGEGEIGGTETTRYTGAIDVDRALEQVESFLRHMPTQSTGGGPVPQLELTPERRAQVKLRGSGRRRRHDPPAAADHALHDPAGQPAGGGRHHGRLDRVPRGLHGRRRGGHHQPGRGRAADRGVQRRARA